MKSPIIAQLPLFNVTERQHIWSAQIYHTVSLNVMIGLIRLMGSSWENFGVKSRAAFRTGANNRAAFRTGAKNRAAFYTGVKKRAAIYTGVKSRAVFRTLNQQVYW